MAELLRIFEGTATSEQRVQTLDNTLAIYPVAATFIDMAGINARDGFEGVSAKELLEVALRINGAANIQDIYEILAFPSLVGKCYYDIVIAPQHRRAHRILESVLDQFEGKVEDGLDIGAGSGETTLFLAKHCSRVTALDASPAILQVARRKLEAAHFNHTIVVGDALALEKHLPPESYDVAIQHGVRAYIHPDEWMDYYRQIHNILKPGGRYFQYDTDGDIAEGIYTTSPRALLVGEIAKMVRDNTFFHRYQTGVGGQIDVRPLGFKAESFLIENRRGRRETVIRITKE